MTWRGTTTVKARIFAVLPYLLPLMIGVQFGDALMRQFPLLELIKVPLIPIALVYQAVPFAGLIVFFLLYLLVVRNENILHFIRFNTMQAILLDIILIICSLILGFVGSSLGGFILETLNNMVFLGMLAAIIYAVVQSLMGRYAEIPTLSDAVYMQVR